MVLKKRLKFRDLFLNIFVRFSAKEKDRSDGWRFRETPNDIYTTDEAIMEAFPDNKLLHKWLKAAKERVHFQGLPSRICWLGYGERAKAGKIFNELVRDRKSESSDCDRS